MPVVMIMTFVLYAVSSAAKDGTHVPAQPYPLKVHAHVAVNSLTKDTCTPICQECKPAL